MWNKTLKLFRNNSISRVTTALVRDECLWPTMHASSEDLIEQYSTATSSRRLDWTDASCNYWCIDNGDTTTSTRLITTTCLSLRVWSLTCANCACVPCCTQLEPINCMCDISTLSVTLSTSLFTCLFGSGHTVCTRWHTHARSVRSVR